MTKNRFTSLGLLGLIAGGALVLAQAAGAQTPAPAKPGHSMDTATTAKQEAEMKAECKAMMAKHQGMEDKLQAMDVTLDKLVAEMNAAKSSKTPDAMDKPIAAVLNELVSQRKATRTLMAEMHSGMAAHQMHHGEMHGAMGSMECPMMKSDMGHEAKMGAEKPKS